MESVTYPEGYCMNKDLSNVDDLTVVEITKGESPTHKDHEIQNTL